MALLSTDEQQVLSVQLAELRKDAVEAERKLDDVCRGLEADLIERLPGRPETAPRAPGHNGTQDKLWRRDP